MNVEIWDLYDAQGEKTGKTMIRGEAIPAGFYHIGVRSMPVVALTGTFIGMVLVVAEDAAPAIEDLLVGQGESVVRLGHVRPGAGVGYRGQLK